MNLLDTKMRITQIEGDLELVESELLTLPPGKLISTINGKRTKWYISDQSNTTYLPKSGQQLAALLAKKKYLTTKKQVLKSELKALQQYSKYHKDNYQLIYDDMLTDSRYSPLFNDMEKNSTSIPSVAAWLNTPYDPNPYHPEKLTHNTISDLVVRSKSEALIANLLIHKNIPFKYECPLVLDGQTFYPDFTILNPRDFKIWYLEHFGIMDNEQYVGTCCKKLQAYCKNGIYPDYNLILTYESDEFPLDINALNLKLSYIFGE